MTRGLSLFSMLTVVIAITSCGPASSPDDEVVVSAAASLTDLFGEIEIAFERDNPSVDVILNFAGSSALREQIVEGAPVDVFASADMANMEVLVGAGLVPGDPAVFAWNQLEIAVPPGNPGAVVGLTDFSRSSLLVGLCSEEVPCGRLAKEVLSNAGVTASVDTNEPDVRSLLTKIELGELDVGLVYSTDVAAADGRVEGIVIPLELNVPTEYPIAVLDDAAGESAGGDFVAWVLSDRGRAIIADHGFVLP